MSHRTMSWTAGIMLLALSVPLAAQTVIEGQIAEVRFDQPQGIHLSDPAQPFVEISPLTLDAPGRTVLDGDKRRIALNELQIGALVTVTGEMVESVFVASEIRITAQVEHTGFGGIITEIWGDELVFAPDHGEWVDRNVEVTFNEEPFGSGLEAVLQLLETTNGPISVTLWDNSPRHSKFRQAHFFQGSTFGKRWEHDTVTIQVIPSADAIPERHEDGFLLKPVQVVFSLPENTKVWDHSDPGFPASEPLSPSAIDPRSSPSTFA